MIAALPIVAVTALAAVLRLAGLGGGGTDAFYDAAVRSMGQSWHNFFFAAFEPSAGVAIDKPPVDLWLQVLTTKVLGFNSTALILPQAIAATLAVPLLYDTVRRPFGRAAGLAAALALAVLPVSVLTARSDTMDSLMMALQVLAAWLAVRAAETGRLRYLLLAAAVMGIDFEVKLFEALIALPAIVVLYAFALRGRARPPARRLAAAVAVFLVAALWWPTAVSLVPRHSRPYPLGSTDGTTWNAIFVFNGTQRLSPPVYNAPATFTASRDPGPAAPARHHGHRRAGVLMGTGDAPGLFRLFQLGRERYGQDLGIELAGAFLLGAVALLGIASASSLQLGVGIGFGVWLLTGYVLFSRMHSGLHYRYLEAMTAAVAAVLAIGAIVSARLAARRRIGLAAFAVVLSVLAVYSVRVAGSDHALAAVSIAAAACAVGAAVVKRSAAAAGLALAVVLVPAAVRSRELVASTSAIAGNGINTSQTTARLSSYLRSHDAGAFDEAATYSFRPAAGLIVHDGRPMLVLTSYTTPVVSVKALQAAVAAGRVRYALIGGACGTAKGRALAACPQTIVWLRHRSVDVTRDAGLSERGLLFRIKSPA